MPAKIMIQIAGMARSYKNHYTNCKSDLLPVYAWRQAASPGTVSWTAT